MGKLTYSAISSLDGYIEDSEGNFDWAEPDEEVHAFANDLERSVGTHLFGRRMYEVMQVWETMDTPALPAVYRDFARFWKTTDKVVYSRTLDTVTTARTRIEREFEPEAVRAIKTASDRDISIAGPEIAAPAFKAGLVDECHLFLVPIIVGGGKQALPDEVRLQLELVDERRFGNGTVYLAYRARP